MQAILLQLARNGGRTGREKTGAHAIGFRAEAQVDRGRLYLLGKYWRTSPNCTGGDHSLQRLRRQDTALRVFAHVISRARWTCRPPFASGSESGSIRAADA